MHWPSSPRHRPTHPHPHRPGKRLKVAQAGPIGPPGVGQRGAGRRHSQWQSLALRFCTFSFYRSYVLFLSFARSLLMAHIASLLGAYVLGLSFARTFSMICTDLFVGSYGPFLPHCHFFPHPRSGCSSSSGELLPNLRAAFPHCRTAFPQWLSGLCPKINHGLKRRFQAVVHTFRSLVHSFPPLKPLAQRRSRRLRKPNEEIL